MSWLSAVPILGDIVKGVVDFVNKRWGVNKTEQEIEKMTQEVLSQGNILDAFKKVYDFILGYEGGAGELAQFGWVGKIIALLRLTWRPVLQWGMTIKVLEALFIYDKPISAMYEEIAFIGGLAVLRELGKFHK